MSYQPNYQEKHTILNVYKVHIVINLETNLEL